MSDCGFCRDAQSDWTFGGYDNGCEGCRIRMLSNSPKFAVDAVLKAIKDSEGEAARDAYREKLAAEFVRRRDLRRKTRGKA